VLGNNSEWDDDNVKMRAKVEIIFLNTSFLDVERGAEVG
jgi:hypothetical protein